MFRGRLQQFMYGRYGADQLSFAMVLAAVVLNIISLFFRWTAIVYMIIRLIGLALLVYSFYRMFSRNIDQRRRENDWFLRHFPRVRGGCRSGCGTQDGYSSYGYDYHENARRVKYKEDKKNYKYFKCPSCATKLRVPRGKGRLTITCPKCRSTFKGKS